MIYILHTCRYAALFVTRSHYGSGWISSSYGISFPRNGCHVKVVIIIVNHISYAGRKTAWYTGATVSPRRGCKNDFNCEKIDFRTPGIFRDHKKMCPTIRFELSSRGVPRGYSLRLLFIITPPPPNHKRQWQ